VRLKLQAAELLWQHKEEKLWFEDNVAAIASHIEQHEDVAQSEIGEHTSAHSLASERSRSSWSSSICMPTISKSVEANTRLVINTPEEACSGILVEHPDSQSALSSQDRLVWYGSPGIEVSSPQGHPSVDGNSSRRYQKDAGKTILRRDRYAAMKVEILTCKTHCHLLVGISRSLACCWDIHVVVLCEEQQATSLIQPSCESCSFHFLATCAPSRRCCKYRSILPAARRNIIQF
jgi:hypothetical protein